MTSKFSPRILPLHLSPLLCIATVVTAFLLLQALQQEALAATYNTASIDELADYSLEDLMQVKAFSASKQPEHVFTTAAAIYVISAKDIHDSGVTSLPEALRLAPGVQVSRIDVNKWAIGIRGFAGRYSNKLLVLQDGRTLYDPLYSGVIWSENEIMLEDIEQIEVIRGPGATLWGTNAVNGVINITTKSAKNTQGGLITASGGTSELGATASRYGVKIGDDGYLRLYGKYFYRQGEPLVKNPDPDIFWRDQRGGFRADWNQTSRNSFTLQGDVFNNFALTTRFQGENLLGRWKSTLSDTSEFSLQLYYNRTTNDSDYNDYHDAWDTGDLELQHSFALGDMQKVVWGSGVRVAHDSINSNLGVLYAFNPTSRTQSLYSAFLQDNITLVPDTIHLILGSRIEHNDTTGWEVLPTARLTVTPNEQHTFWGAVSRAVRTPSRSETTISSQLSPASPPYAPEVRLVGTPSVPSEKLIAYEAGYRYHPLKTLSFDLALFYNDYSSLIGVQKGTMTTFFPINVAPALTATGKGGELAIDWRPLTWMNLVLAYSYLDLTVTSSSPVIANGLDLSRSLMYADTAPRHQLSIHSTTDLSSHVKCTLWLRYVDSLPMPGPGVPDYVTMDARIAWKPLPTLELSLVGQNLFEPTHREYGIDTNGDLTAPVARSMYGKVAWSF